MFLILRFTTYGWADLCLHGASLKSAWFHTGAAIHMHIVKLQAQSLCILLHENQRDK